MINDADTSCWWNSERTASTDFHFGRCFVDRNCHAKPQEVRAYRMGGGGRPGGPGGRPGGRRHDGPSRANGAFSLSRSVRMGLATTLRPGRVRVRDRRATILVGGGVDSDGDDDSALARPLTRPKLADRYRSWSRRGGCRGRCRKAR
jgi:hypothetical protein